MKNIFDIHKGRFDNGWERLFYLLAELGGFVDLLVYLLSCTYFVSYIRCQVLFADGKTPFIGWLAKRAGVDT